MVKTKITKVSSFNNSFKLNRKLKHDRLIKQLKAKKKLRKKITKLLKRLTKLKLKSHLSKLAKLPSPNISIKDSKTLPFQKTIPSYDGVIHLLCNKRNIFCTLADYNGRIKASVSTGRLKVKGRKKIGFIYVPRTAQLLINHLFKLPYRKFLVIIKGNGPKKKKRSLINSFLKVKKFKYIWLNNLAPRSHNGCRPPKLRRK